MIPVFRPAYDDREERAVLEVLRSGWIGLGPKVAQFEDQFAATVGARFGVGLSSCTEALCLALHQLGVGPEDEVLVPTITFVSTAAVVRQLGAVPVICDVDERTLLIDWQDAARRRTERTKAAIPVLYAGQPLEVPEDWDLPLVYDCAHAAGADFSAAGKTCCWSFHAVKNLATGDGGMLTSDDEAFCQRARRLRWLGIDRSTWDRTKVDRGYWWEYRIEELGYKCHMNDITAALGLVQLDKLPELQQRRRELVDRYRLNLEGMLELPPHDPGSSQHLFVVRTDARDDLSTFLAEEGISTSVHYMPLHLYPCFADSVRLPTAERVWQRILTLPLFPDLSVAEVDRICARIVQFCDTPERSIDRIETYHIGRPGVCTHAS